MDERHWWIATKIQETFQVEETDSPTALEHFLLEPNNFDLLSQLLIVNGINKLFVYGRRPEGRPWMSEDLNMVPSLINIKGVGLNDLVCVFLLRPVTQREVDQVHMHKQIFCGEIKNNPLHQLSTVLSQVFIPMVKAKEDWGKSTDEHKQQFIHSVEKYSNMLHNATSKSSATSQQILRLPDQLISRDFSQHRISTQFDAAVIQAYEEILQEWMQAIDGVLSEGADDRLLDINSGPLTELERWKRRQRMLAGITEQLKSKECKNVIGILIQAKSRILRSWRAIDISITDAQNETKDKVKYLDGLRRHLEQLHLETNPVTVVNVVLPTLIGAIRQMDSISRFYARSGYLGLLCMKIGNQLASICRDYVGDILKGNGLWRIIEDEIDTDVAIPPSFKSSKKGSKKKELIHEDDKTLIGRLHACLAMQTFYKDLVRNLRDTMGTANTTSHSLTQSISSLDAPLTRTKASKKAKLTAPGSVVSGSDGKEYASFSYGISMFDDEAILGNLDLICGRIKQLLEVIASLRQFTKLAKDTAGLPRPRLEDIPTGQNSNESNQDERSVHPSSPKERSTDGVMKLQNYSIFHLSTHGQQSMLPVPEEDEDIDDDINFAQENKTPAKMPDSDSDVEENSVISSTCYSPVQSQYNAASYLRHLFSTEEEGPSISTLIFDNVTMIIHSMSTRITSSMLLDLHRKHKEKFDETFNFFTGLTLNLDQLLSIYLQAVFAKPMKTQQGLDLLSKFNAVTQRPNVKELITELYSNVYAIYTKELECIQEMYEKYKNNPTIPRDAPPAAGAIYWSRQLLSHIEEPMKAFQENKSLSQNKEYHRTVKFYNRLATALVKYETLWYQQWYKSVDQSVNGLRASLLKQINGELVVNADPQLLHLLQESKWMLRLKLDIPSAAKTLLAREKQFKLYKIHLEQCLHDYNVVCSMIPMPFMALFKPHISSVVQCLQAGLNTITWDSMNIDAFLHKARSTTQRLNSIVIKVNEVVETKVEKEISCINDLILFEEHGILGKTWNAAELLLEMNKSINMKSKQLHNSACIIEGAIQDIIMILTSSRINSAEHHQNANMSKSLFSKTIHHRGHGGSNSASSGSSKASSNIGFEPEEFILQKIYLHYSTRTYKSTLHAVCQSLVSLTKALGTKSDEANVMYNYSRPGSSQSSSEIARTDSSLSFISTASWWEESFVETSEEGSLKFIVNIKFRIPDIVLDPPLSDVQQTIDEMVETLTAATRGVLWWAGPNKHQTFESDILIDETVSSLKSTLVSVTKGLKSYVRQYIQRLSQYNFLWKDDMQRSYTNFMNPDPGMSTVRKEVEYLLEVEKKIASVPSKLSAGSVILCPSPVRDALQGLAAAWKTQYALVLYEDAKKKLDSVVQYRNNVQSRLSAPVLTLDQLNSTLGLLEEIHDMENKIDGVYLPIENMYDKLKSYDLRLARAELQQVKSLRQSWIELVTFADDLGQTLVKERRTSFEQELDKQLKTFVVEVIQFRNSFDAQGPAVPGVRPAEAVQRLHDFQNRYTLYNAKRKTLDSVQRLFGIPPKPFPELDKTGEELKLLGMLYGLFQKFIAFDKKFRDTLWEGVDLHSAHNEVQGYWEECLNLPIKLKEWDAYTEMKNSINFYLDVLPLLHRLAKKGKFKDIMIPEIRNRHWLQVMSVTNSKFQLEANLFKLGHLLDIGLLKHKDEIRHIAIAASKELELEVKMRGVEEEWTEQVLTFDNYKRRGPVLLVKEDSERLLEQLEDAQALLANMLTSKHIGPLREEAASWAEKLKGVGEVLDLWLETQDLWLDLEAVFSDHTTSKELPQEAKRFSMVDKSYVKLVRRAFDTKNILQCCYGGEVPKGVVLRHMQEELEICFKCLTQYLDKKRLVCPRFYFLTDPALLALLSRPSDIESVRPHLRTIFSSITDIKLEKSSTWSDTVSSMKSAQNTPTPVPPDRRFALGDDVQRSSRFKTGIKSCDSPHFSASIADEVIEAYHATAVMATNKEYLHLEEEVSLYEGVELWLQNLQESINRSLQNCISKAVQDVDANLPTEELAYRYPGQVARLAILYLWTKECESAIGELKWDRKALHNASKKFSNIFARFPAVLNRGSWRGIDESMLTIHKLRLENMIMYSVYLRDLMDGIAARKIRELGDFEWRRSIRFYSTEGNELSEHQVAILDAKYDYGLEFYGLSSTLVMTPSTERAFVSMSNALQEMQGCAVFGETCTGKTETVQGLAALLGKFLFLVSCSDTIDLGSLSKILQGLSAHGSWGCFDDIHLLSNNGLSVILEFTSTIFKSIRSQETHAFVSCLGNKGQQITINPQVGFFLTVNQLSCLQPLSTAVRSFYRTIHLTKPDISAILKAYCTAIGLRAPKALADRLRTLVELAHQQIPRQRYHEVNLPSILFAANLAAQKRKSKEERIESRAEAARPGDDLKLSRSNSQTSVRQTFPQISPSPTVARALVVDKVVTKKTTSSPNTLTSQAKIDHGFVAQALLETISPGLVSTEHAIFNNIVRDVFSGIQYVRDVLTSMSGTSPNGSSTMTSSAAKNHDMETAINQVAQERGFVAHGNWVNKVLQVYHMAQLRQGVVIAGSVGTGKSSIISVLVDALCLMPHNHGTGRATSPGMSSHKLQKLNPMTVDDMSLMFGSINHSNEWVDGLLTHAWRKANRNQSTTWLCLDSPLVNSWADHFNSALDAHKFMALINGEKLQLTNNMRLIFETSSLKNASPSLLSRSGLVYIDKHVLGWRPLAKAWLDTRTKQEVLVLQKSFNKTLDPVCAFVFNESRLKIPVCEVGLFSTCLTLLSEMLNEHQQHIGGDLHVERLFLFCLVWAFGGLLEGNAIKAFSDLLKTLSSALPDYDHEISVFDYYVDESGEWDSWSARVPEATYTGTTDILGEVFVDTIDTIRVRSLLEFAHMAHKHTLIIGECGIGKTALVSDFLDTQDKQWSVLHRLVFSHATTASQLHSFIQHNIQHRQGFVYGAKDGKHLEVFIDDVNLPSKDRHGIQRCNELLRALMDDHTICKLTKPFEWRTVEGLQVLATLTTGSAQFNLDPRLLRHFAVLRLRTPSGGDLRSIIFSVLEANLSDRPLNQDLHDCIATASCKLLEQVKEVLRPSFMPGRYHYTFCLRQLTKMCQCLCRLGDEDRAKDLYVVSLWKHELHRLIGDQLCRTSDILWFDETLNKITNDTFSHYIEQGKELSSCFVTFPVETKLHHRPIASSHHSIRIQLHEVTDPKDTLECLKAHLTHFNEDQQQSHDTLNNIMFSDDTLCHIIRMHRVLCYHHGGSMVLVGSVGSHLTQLTRLALHVADLRPFTIDSSRPTAFFDSLRTAIRVAGTDGRPVSVVLSARELHNPAFLDAINSLLVAGEYPHLFSNDEMDGLLQVLTPTLRRHFPNMMSDPMKFFVSRVKCNLHLVLILPPHHSLLKESLHNYPGILSESQIIWIRDWPQEVLVQQAEYFINYNNVAHDTSHKTREALTMAIANMHSLTLRDCKQTSWAGETNGTVSITGTSLQTKKDKESIKVEKMEMPNLPYSKSILLERIKIMNKDSRQRASVEIFIGPYTYRKFMECFNQLYMKHSRILHHETTKLKRALDTLDETRKDAKTMQKAIQVLRYQYNSSKIHVSELFKQLTTEATRLEKLKAHFGTGGGSLHAFLQLTQEVDSDYEEDVLLRYEENDEYDKQFEAMREANLKSKRVQVDEDIATANKDLDEARLSLATAKNQVEHWKSKVDRGCIERLKAFKKPPRLVAQVLEMVMVLVGARPWLVGSRADQLSQGGRGDVKTPRTSRKNVEHVEGSDKSSRVSSGSTLKIDPKKSQKQPKLSRQLTRSTSSFGVTSADRNEAFVGRNKWKTMQNFMNDTVRFVEMIHSVDWETGLNEVILHDVESYLYKGKEGQEGVTGEGSLLQESQTVIQQRKATAAGITISAARYSSEDAAVLVEYVISIVEYTRRCGPLKQAMDYLHQLEAERDKIQQAEIEDQKPILKSEDSDGDISIDEDGIVTATSIDLLTKDDIQRLQSAVNSLQQKYDEAVVKKHHLKDELVTSQERLRSALNTLENLKPLEKSWKVELSDIISNEELVTNCVLASACLTYCGGMTSDAQNRMTSFYTHVCKHYELPIPKRMLFNNFSLHEFLFMPVEVQTLCTKKLPVDTFTLDQTCQLTFEHATWCLVCDPVAKIVDWLKGYFDGELIVVQYCDLRAQFETSLSEGNTLVITYCDVVELSTDFRFREVFRHRANFHSSKTTFKMMVGDHEVECNPNFRLFLHTATMPQDVPPELAAYTTLIYNQSTRVGIQLELLDRFMELEKPRLHDEWKETQRDKLKNMNVLNQLEGQLKGALAGDHRLLNDISVTKKLADIKKLYDEATEMKSKIDSSENSIERAKEGFNQVALRGAVLFDVARAMKVVNPLYHYSWRRFVSLYDESIHQSERCPLKVVCNEMTYNIFFTISRTLFECDRILFALLMALEVEDSNGNVNVGEREFLISPDYGLALMHALGYHASETRSQAKKTFDWMTDDQFHNIQVLATYYDWFHDLFDRMPRDGREMQWRLICEGDSPEVPNKCRLPDNADEHYTPLQRLLVIRAIRNDRIVQASTEFIYRVLGKKFMRDEAADLNGAIKQANAKTPIVLLFNNENNLALQTFTEFAVKSEVAYDVVFINGCGTGEERKAKKCLTHAIDNGSWILLHHAHSNIDLIQTLYSYINEAININPTFQLWLTCEATNKLPTSLLHASVKLVIHIPTGMKDNLLRFATTHLNSDVINTSSRPEWLPCLHNVCLLHGTIQLRARLPPCVGWQDSSAFNWINSEQLKASVAVITREFVDIQSGGNPDASTNIMLRNISWSGLRYQVGEIIYGSYLTNVYDQLALNALVDYWLAASSVKKEFELPRVKYRLPAVLFAPSVKQTSIIQAIDSISQHSLDVAEACNLHPTPEAVIGDDQYIFTRLNSIYDFLPESSTLSHKLYPRPATAMDVPPQTSISNTSSHPWVIHRGVFATHSHALLKSRKEVELWEVAYNALPKIPKAWSKEYVSDRIRKLGGATPFNLFLQKELKQLHKLLTEIKRSLISVKAAVESLDQFGDRLSSIDVIIANDLSRSRIPRQWMLLAGDTAPPDNTSLSQWLNDIALRVSHFERILALGKDKLPAYWLGAFFNPHALVSALKQEAIKAHIEKSGSVDNVVFRIEVTQRDKDHLRDPPSEGFFLHGVYLWGCTWDKTSGEVLDVPPKHGPIPLPVIHVTFSTEVVKYGTGSELTKPVDYYGCPVFITCTSSKEAVFELDVLRESIPSSRWALRGLTATIRPY